eukprot:GHVT01085805.1.p1 GENE.GHVT01085805.1~~GHVT01085805.1.p1  ORF type:complete len:320 (-),score=35.58 GHVT01085805.1:900-1859(-)
MASQCTSPVVKFSQQPKKASETSRSSDAEPGATADSSSGRPFAVGLVKPLLLLGGVTLVSVAYHLSKLSVGSALKPGPPSIRPSDAAVSAIGPAPPSTNLGETKKDVPALPLFDGAREPQVDWPVGVRLTGEEWEQCLDNFGGTRANSSKTFLATRLGRRLVNLGAMPRKCYLGVLALFWGIMPTVVGEVFKNHGPALLRVWPTVQQVLKWNVSAKGVANFLGPRFPEFVKNLPYMYSDDVSDIYSVTKCAVTVWEKPNDWRTEGIECKYMDSHSKSHLETHLHNTFTGIIDANVLQVILFAVVSAMLLIGAIKKLKLF